MSPYDTGYADIDLDELSPEARAKIEALNLRRILTEQLEAAELDLPFCCADRRRTVLS